MAAPRASEATEPVPAVALTCRTSHPSVLAGGTREVHLLVSMTAAELPEAPRPPMNLALVVDRSGSMAVEEKLVHAKHAAEQLVQRLSPEDRLAVLAYDHEVRTLVPSTRVVDRTALLEAIRALAPGGSTDLHAGLVAGTAQVQNVFDTEAVNQVLLLSDGLANRGVTSPADIAASAQRAREHGVRISAMGLGLDYDEDLLIAIAKNAGGRYDYVGEPEEVGRHLDRVIDELSRIVARNLALRIELGPGVRLVEAYGHRHRMEGRTAVISLQDMHAGQHDRIVVRLAVTEGGADQPLASAALAFVEVDGSRTQNTRARPTRVAFVRDALRVEAEKDLDVLAQVEVVHNALALLEAMKLQKLGRLRDAQEVLSTRYLNSKTRNAAELKSEEVERILQRIEQTMKEIERTRSEPRAGRDLQLSTQISCLGYL